MENVTAPAGFNPFEDTSSRKDCLCLNSAVAASTKSPVAVSDTVSASAIA